MIIMQKKHPLGYVIISNKNYKIFVWVPEEVRETSGTKQNMMPRNDQSCIPDKSPLANKFLPSIYLAKPGNLS